MDISISAGTPEDLLAYLPHRLGFLPRRSVVVAAVTPDADGGHILGVTARADIDDLGDPDLAPSILDTLAARIADDAAVAAFVVLYSDATLSEVRAGAAASPATVTAGGDGDAAAAAMVTGTVSRICPTSVHVVTPEAYACLECASEPCCPPSGHPIERLMDTAVGASMVAAGSSPVRERAHLAVPRGPRGLRRQLAGAGVAAVHRGRPLADGPELRRWRRAVLSEWTAALAQSMDQGSVDPGSCGRLAASLIDADVRDAVFTAILGSRRDPRGGEPLRLPDVFAASAVPDPDVMAGWDELLVLIVTDTPVPEAAFALALLAWLSWWSGQGARAAVIAGQALEEDPRCRLAALIGSVLEAGLAPGWVREATKAI